MDPFDEFEFKPITDGLGFHNTKNTDAPISKRHQEMEFIEETISEKSRPVAFMVKNPLPRETKPRIQEQPLNKTTETVDEILRTLNEKKKYDFVEKAKSLRNEVPQSQLKTSCFDLSAALLDAMLITAMFLTSMVILLVVTKVDLISNLLNPDEGGQIYLGTLGLFASITWIYLVVNRMFLGRTPGEWVFDQQIGLDREIGGGAYSVKVALRSLLIIATGLIPLPFLSLISRYDLAGKITGTQIYKRA